VLKWEKIAAGGKKISAYHHGGIWHNPSGCGGYCGFDSAGFQNMAAHKALPIYAWGSQSTDSSQASSFTNAAVAAGAQDAYIHSWASSAKAFGHKFILMPNWEFNGNWYPWAPQQGGVSGSASDFVAAWRHIVKIFKQVGAKNVQFGWVPNVDDGYWAKTSGYSLKSLYPGDKYVDWVGMDGYNPGGSAWMSFSKVFGGTYKALHTIAPKKPVLINEVGCTESGGSKAKWIKDMFNDLPKKFSKIKLICWYNRADPGPGGHTDWPLESSKSALKAFKAGIKSSRYAAGK